MAEGGGAAGRGAGAGVRIEEGAAGFAGGDVAAGVRIEEGGGEAGLAGGEAGFGAGGLGGCIGLCGRGGVGFLGGTLLGGFLKSIFFGAPNGFASVRLRSVAMSILLLGKPDAPTPTTLRACAGRLP